LSGWKDLFGGAIILEIYGVDCIEEGFIDGQLYWLNKWQEAFPVPAH